MKTWLNVAEAAEYAGVSRDTIYTACERREIHHARIGTPRDSAQGGMDRRLAGKTLAYSGRVAVAGTIRIWCRWSDDDEEANSSD
jgi:excisionase family DNA binding protein